MLATLVKDQFSVYAEMHKTAKELNDIEHHKCVEIEEHLAKLYELNRDDQTKLDDLNSTLEKIKNEMLNEVHELTKRLENTQIRMKDAALFYASEHIFIHYSSLLKF